jgi:phospholipase/carboxylesterase
MSALLEGAVKLDTGKNPQYAVLWLHGLGADGHDFESIVPELIAPKWPALRFVFPHAPVQPVSINGGASMRAWYDIKSLDREGLQDDVGIRKSVVLINNMIAALENQGIPHHQIFLAGFSQGGAVALAAGLRYPRALAGVIGLSCYLPLGDTTAAQAAAANQKTPIFLGHGTFDPVVALQYGEASAKALTELGYTVSMNRYPMQHSVNAQEISDLRKFMEIQFKSE